MGKKQRTSNLNYNNGSNLARSVQATLQRTTFVLSRPIRSLFLPHVLSSCFTHFFARPCQRPSSIISSAAFSMAKQMIIHQQHIFILFCTVTLNVCPLFFFRVVSILFAALIVHVSICHVIAISTLVQVAHNQSSHINTDTRGRSHKSFRFSGQQLLSYGRSNYFARKR